MPVIATAGHVDHGKSTLVHALTGMDPDRFAEEKARGLTIDLGFAWTTLPSGREVAFVDVPGHVRFIKNMLAGVGAVDGCVFVVAATEGWKPQSEEHLRILELLGVDRGVVALTKVGLVDEEWRELAVLDVADRVAGTFLEHAPVIAVDAVAGVGVDELASAVDRLDTGVPVDHGRPRLWIDRVFAATGSGTVVTGTLTGGSVRVGDELVTSPAGHEVRVRALQSHKSSLQTATPGRRLAVNVVGVERTELARGHALVRPGQWTSTRMVDASLSVLASLDHDVGRKGAYAAYVGSGEHPVRLRVLGEGGGIRPGATGLVRLHLETALPLLPGDRYVLRESGRGETVGGGEVLDVAPVLSASRARPDRSVDRVVAERGWVDVDELERLTGERRRADVGAWVVDAGVRDAAITELRRRIEDAGPMGLDVATLDERDRALLETLDGVRIEGGRAGATDDVASHPWLAELSAAPFQPPAPADVAVARELVRRGLVVERDGIYFAASAVEEGARLVARLLAGQPEGVTIAEIREAMGTSRKYAMPLVAHLDATGVTRRRGDVRIAGPRLPGS